MSELIDAIRLAGHFAGHSRENILAARVKRLAEGKATSEQQILFDARVIDIQYRPTPDGGWLMIYQDVTDRNSIEKALREQSTYFVSTLQNMTQGICMFDTNRRLLVCNDQYARIFKLTPELTRPGTLLEDILERRIALGQYDGSDPTDFIAKRVQLACERKSYAQDLTLIDGRVIAVVQRPMADGGWVATFEEVTERRLTEARLAHMALHDSLTDLPNRTMFQQRLAQALVDVENNGSRSRNLALLLLDLDHFKKVNDTLGHAAGDDLLLQVTRKMTHVLGKTATVLARLGGDEFAVVLSYSRPNEVARTAKLLLKEVTSPYLIGEQEASVGVSIGIALLVANVRTSEQLMRAADVALYRAKSGGRSTFCFFDPAWRSSQEVETAGV